MDDLTTQLVTGRWSYVVADGFGLVDGDREPDEVGPTGQVHFTAEIGGNLSLPAGAPIRSVILGLHRGLIVDGELQDLNGLPGVRLPMRIGEHPVYWTAQPFMKWRETTIAASPVRFGPTADPEIRLNSVLDPGDYPALGDAVLRQIVSEWVEDQSDDRYAPRWRPFATYVQGQAVLLPDGTIGTAKATFTTAASFTAANWTVVAGSGTPADGSIGTAKLADKAVTRGKTSDDLQASLTRADNAAPTGHTHPTSSIVDLAEYIQDTVAGLIKAGANVTTSYDDAANTFTINATGGGGGTTDPEVVRDTIGGALVAGSGVSITVDDPGDTITIAVAGVPQSAVTGLSAALTARQLVSEKGQPSGYAGLDSDGKVPTTQLPAGSSGPKITQSTTAPSSPSTGDLWIDTNDNPAGPVPDNSVPLSALVEAIRTTLGKADTALQTTTADGRYAPRGTFVRSTGQVSTPGILDWGNDSTDGYAIHLTLGANSGSAVAAIGIGTDAGGGSGIIVSHKNSGRAMDIGVQATAGHGLQITGRSAVGYIARFLAKAGALGVTFKAEAGQGFADGVTTAGSTTLTSATAAFTAADVGRTLTQTASRSSAPTGTLPAGVTIQSVTDAQTVVMSAAAAGAATGLMFEVGSRPVPDSQALLTVQDESSAHLTQIYKQGILARGSMTNIPPLRARRKASQTAAIQTWEDENGVALSQVGPSGHLMTKVTTAAAASGLAASTLALSLDDTAGAPRLVVVAKDSAGTAATGYLPIAGDPQLVVINPQTGSYTLVPADAGKAVEVTSSAAATVTVPTNASAAIPVGAVIEVVQTGAGQVTVAAASGVTINTSSSMATRAQWSVIALRKRATDTWVLAGDTQ